MFHLRIPEVVWFLAGIIPWSSNADAEEAVIKLNADNFLDVTSKKSVMIKFYAPRCARCEAMKEDWERLAQDWKDSETGLVAEVECKSIASTILCEDFEVKEFPTILYGDPRFPYTYDGSPDYESLAEIAREHLNHAPCNLQTVDDGVCPEDAQAVLKDLMSKSREELEELERAADAKQKEDRVEYDDQIDHVTKEYEEGLKTYQHLLVEGMDEMAYAKLGEAEVKYDAVFDALTEAFLKSLDKHRQFRNQIKMVLAEWDKTPKKDMNTAIQENNGVDIQRNDEL